MCSFDVVLSVCLSVRSGAVNQTSLKRLKLRSSNLTCMFPGTVRTWPLENFSNLGGFCKNSLGGDMHSDERLLVTVWSPLLNLTQIPGGAKKRPEHSHALCSKLLTDF